MDLRDYLNDLRFVSKYCFVLDLKYMFVLILLER